MDKTVLFTSVIIITSNVALNDGSSKQGSALRASHVYENNLLEDWKYLFLIITSNCVVKVYGSLHNECLYLTL